MRYKLSNGKSITIPDEEIKKGMDLLGLTKEESIQMYLEDNGHECNEEQENLEEYAKTVKINHGAGDKTKRKKSTKPRTYKNSDVKTELIQYINDKLTEYVTEKNGSLTIVKEGKLFGVTIGEAHLSIDVIQNHKENGWWTK